MLKHPQITEGRIRKVLSRLKSSIHPQKQPVAVEAWNVGGEPVPFATALKATYQPISVGDAWGLAWDTTWFRIRGTVPPEWAGRDVVVRFALTDEGGEGFTAEGLIYANGIPVRAINRNRDAIEVSQCATGGEAFEFYVEGAANVSTTDIATEVIDKNASLTPRCYFKLTTAELSYVDHEIAAYYHDFRVATESLFALPENGQRRAELLYALNESANQWNENDRATLAPARKLLEEVLAKKNGDTVHQLSAIGHSHIDTAWLWPLRETIRKCARTFSTAVDYMGHYPDYIFGCSQAQQYAWMKALYPTVYEGMKEYAKRGQWEPIGSMWVEADCNLASGESLIRQIVQGKRFFKEEFNYETRDVWLPDVFGYSAAMPQILKGCDIDYFVTQKISWSQFNKFPHHTFLWEGIDGTRVFTHFPPADTYNATMVPKELIFNVNNFKEHGRATRSLYVYGYGDGGGGPSTDMLEAARRLRDFDGMPTVTQEKVIDFLQKAEKDAKDPAVWVGELYLELHRGTYTTQAKNKRGNRKSELLLRDAEFWDAISFALVPDRKESVASPARAVYDVSQIDTQPSTPHAVALDRAWKLVLLNQFHDIIPGSSIGWVYKDSTVDYATITELGESVIASSLSALNSQINTTGIATPVRVSNTLTWERSEIVDFPDGSVRKVTVPSAGYAVLDAAVVPTAAETPVSVTRDSGAIEIDNGLLRISIGANGLLESIWDIEADREVIAPGAQGNLFQLHPDEPNQWDAWEIDISYKERVQNLCAIDRLEVIENHPLRAKVRIERSFGKSRIEQDIIVTAGSRRIDFATRVDWREDSKLLKVAFPVDVRSQRATYEIQYGHVERPNHYNTSWDLARFEVCAHKWADLSEGNYGVALLNDCKYGYDIQDNILRLSLLRSPNSPDADADRGEHQFTYSLLPHQGDFRQGGVIQEGYNLNVPLRVEALEHGTGPLGPTHSFLTIHGSGVIAEAVKIGEDKKSVVIRLYEAFGTRSVARLHLALPVKTVRRTNMLENEAGEIELTAEGDVAMTLRPFEIVTLKLEL